MLKIKTKPKQIKENKRRNRRHTSRKKKKSEACSLCGTDTSPAAVCVCNPFFVFPLAPIKSGLRVLASRQELIRGGLAKCSQPIVVVSHCGQHHYHLCFMKQPHVNSTPMHKYGPGSGVCARQGCTQALSLSHVRGVAIFTKMLLFSVY